MQPCVGPTGGPPVTPAQAAEPAIRSGSCSASRRRRRGAQRRGESTPSLLPLRGQQHSPSSPRSLLHPRRCRLRGSRPGRRAPRRVVRAPERIAHAPLRRRGSWADPARGAPEAVSKAAAPVKSPPQSAPADVSQAAAPPASAGSENVSASSSARSCQVRSPVRVDDRQHVAASTATRPPQHSRSSHLREVRHGRATSPVEPPDAPAQAARTRMRSSAGGRNRPVKDFVGVLESALETERAGSCVGLWQSP